VESFTGSLAGQAVDLLRHHELTITTVESCTGGGVVNAITNIPGASEVLQRAFVVYSNGAKIDMGVPVETIREYTVYSMQTALAMARAGLQVALEADISVGITGSISRVDPANTQNSVPGRIYIAVVGVKSGIQITRQREHDFSDQGDREKIKEAAIQAALKMINAVILDIADLQ
jgi:nicotinamide mononucleotide (NMN) deamidase PncC